MAKKFIVETSARHVHLTAEAFATLFGEGKELTVKKMLSQPGQFGPAATGQVASIMANGPKSSCMQAAQAAINGETVIGNLTHFKRAGSTDGIVIGAHVFY